MISINDEKFKEKNEKNEKNEENVENYKDKSLIIPKLVESDDFKLPIPEDHNKLKRDKYYENFHRRFNKKFSKNFFIKKIKCDMILDQPEFSFIIFITNIKKNFSYLFDYDCKYIGLELKEKKSFTNVVIITIVLVRDD